MRAASPLAFLIITAALWGGGVAHAGNFEITPVRLTLSAAVKSAMLEVSNQSGEESRLQAKVQTWTEGPRGEMELADTKEVIVFPTLFSLKPGATRKLRVATRGGGPITTERTYRIIIEELPAARRKAEAGAVAMLMRMSIPLFVTDTRFRPAPRIEDVSVKAGTLSFTLKNPGSRFYVARKIHFEALDEAGRRVGEHEMAGWYVLPGRSRIYDVKLSPEACTARRLSIDIETEEQTRAKVSYDLPPGACSS